MSTRKQQEAMLLQLNEVFPDMDLQVLANILKQVNFEYDLAVQKILDEVSTPSEIGVNSKNMDSNNNNNVQTIEVSKSSSYFPYEMELKRVMELLPEISKETAKVYLEKNKGDADLVVFKLLNDPSSLKNEQNNKKETNEKKEDNEEEEEKEESEENEELISSEEDAVNYDDEWFLNPLEEIELQNQRSKLQEAQQKIASWKQEIADEELAYTLQKIEEEEDLKKIRASNNTFLNNIDPSAYGPPESTKKRSYGYYQPQVTIVPPSSMVQEFLEKIENEEVMDQMNQTTKSTPPPRIHKPLSSVLSGLQNETQKLKDIEQTRHQPWELKKVDAMNENNNNLIDINSNECSQTSLKLITLEDVGIVASDYSVVGTFSSFQECSQEQENEIEALKSFFQSDYTEADSYPKRFQIQINHKTEKSTKIGLIIQFLPKYPFVPPKISIVSNSLISIGLDHQNQIQSLLKSATKILLSQQMVFTLVNIVERWLELSPIQTPSIQNTLGFEYQDSLKLILSDKSYECLTPEKFLQLHRARISLVQEKLNISPSLASVLLSNFKWNTDKVIDIYKQASSSEENLKQFLNKYGFDSSSNIHLDGIFEKRFECPSCLDEFTVEEMTAMSCGHFFCNPCFSNYLTVQIAEVGNTSIHCPAYKCKYSVDDITISSLINFELFHKYNWYILKHFVDNNVNIKWCPGKRCENAMRIQSKDESRANMVRCNCGLIWCFSCLQEGHWPATCKQIKWYNETHDRKHSSDPDANEKTLEWLKKYTQDCPKCHSPIEKNGGCNHMVCKSCSSAFCWVCLGAWTGGSHYNCVAVNVSSKQRDLSRYFQPISMSFDQLYLLHDSSRAHDDVRIKRIAMQKMKAYLQNIHSSTLEDVSVIVQAIEHIFLCRHIILNLCLIGLYNTHFKLGGTKKLKHEIGNLQAHINLVSSMLDVPIKKLDLKSIAQFTQGIRSGIKHLHERLFLFKKTK